MENAGTITKRASRIAGLLFLAILPIASAQLQLGENLRMKAGGLMTAGYSGDYGDSAQIQSDHGIDFGFNGNVTGSYYNPNFISFSVTPYYNQSRADSDFQSITGASGVTATARSLHGQSFPWIDHLPRRLQQHRNLWTRRSTQLHYSRPRRWVWHRLERADSGSAHFVSRVLARQRVGTVYGQLREQLRYEAVQYSIYVLHRGISGSPVSSITTASMPPTRNFWLANRNRFPTPVATIMVLA